MIAWKYKSRRLIFTSLLFGLFLGKVKNFENKKATKTIEEMALDYEDDKNSAIAVRDKENIDLYEDFYEELDNRVRSEQSMNIIYFGPPNSFLRLDSETVLHILVHTKKHLIPISRVLLAWDIITDGKTAAFLQGRELVSFGKLLNIVPEEDLYYLNFGDPLVLRFFSNSFLALSRRKYGVLIAAYRRYYGNNWYMNSTHINELGYLICGFPSYDLKKISPQHFKEINIDVMSKIEKCNVEQTKTLYNIATHPDAYGEPYKWSSHEIGRLNTLLTCIPKEDISSIQLEAIPAMSRKVIEHINQDKLQYFTKQQIFRMNPQTRRLYMLRMLLKGSLDMSQIARKNDFKPSPTVLTLGLSVFVTLVIANHRLADTGSEGAT